VEITQAAHVRVTHVPKHHRQNKNGLKMEKKITNKKFRQAAHVRVTHVPKHHRQNKNGLKMKKKLLTKSFDTLA
jgi:hypothetical protein